MDSNRRSFLRFFLPVAAAAPLALTAAADAKSLILPPPPLHVPQRCSVVSSRGPCVNFCAPHAKVCAAHGEKITVRLIRAYDPTHDLMLTRIDAHFGMMPEPFGVESWAISQLGHGEMVSMDLRGFYPRAELEWRRLPNDVIDRYAIDTRF
jgi:hypothetical protein